MTRIRVESFTISLDGYGAGPNQSLEQPLGEGGPELHQWALPTRTFQRAVFGKDGGATGVDETFAARGFTNIGAWVMGRNMFGPMRGPWPDFNWQGWWGDNPPYQVPVFVLTHHERPPLEMEGGTIFKVVADVVLEIGDEHSVKQKNCPCGMSIAPVDYGILNAMTRLAKLLDSPADAGFLAPLIKREIIYRALVGEMGAWMRSFVKADSQAHRISHVIEELKARFTEPLRVGELAENANMSKSALYHTFKEVTRMSPVQYQKKLRLHEARRLMLSEGLEASTASFKVGYESPSHFSREYSRMFGAPPRADVMRLRGGERQLAAGAH